MIKNFEATLKRYVRENYIYLIMRDISNRRNPITRKYRHYINVYDGDILTCKEYASIRGLYFFWKDNNDLTESQVEDIIKHHNKTFKFLNKVIDLMPNVLCELKEKGPRAMAERYMTINERASGVNNDK